MGIGPVVLKKWGCLVENSVVVTEKLLGTVFAIKSRGGGLLYCRKDVFLADRALTPRWCDR